MSGQTILCEMSVFHEASARKPAKGDLGETERESGAGWCFVSSLVSRSAILQGDFCNRLMGLVILHSLTDPLWMTHSATLRARVISNLG